MSVRYAEFTREDVEFLFRNWARARFFPEDMIDMCWDEMLVLINSIDELRIKEWAKEKAL